MSRTDIRGVVKKQSVSAPKPIPLFASEWDRMRGITSRPLTDKEELDTKFYHDTLQLKRDAAALANANKHKPWARRWLRIHGQSFK